MAPGKQNTDTSSEDTVREHRRVYRNGSLVFAGVFLALTFAVAWREIRPLSFRSVPVENTIEISHLQAPPARSVRDGTVGLEPLAAELPKLSGPTLARAEAIRSWVRNQQSDAREVWMGASDDSSDDAVQLLDRMRSGFPGSCRRMAYVLVGALQAGGIDARVAVLARSIGDGAAYHSTVEAWLPEEKRWILIDASYDTLFLVAGRPVSGAEAVDVWRAGGIVEFSRQTTRKPFPRHAFFAPFRHLYVAKQSPAVDGAIVRGFSPWRVSFLHYHPGAPPYPEGLKRFCVVVIFGSAAGVLGIALVLLARLTARLLATPSGRSLPRWPENPPIARPAHQRSRIMQVDDVA